MGRIQADFTQVDETAAATLPLAHTTSETLLGDETILLVEDDESVRELAHAVLAEAGYQVIAASGETAQALRHEIEGPLHLLLTDVIMPRISGRELDTLLRKVRDVLDRARQ